MKLCLNERKKIIETVNFKMFEENQLTKSFVKKIN